MLALRRLVMPDGESPLPFAPKSWTLLSTRHRREIELEAALSSRVDEAARTIEHTVIGAGAAHYSGGIFGGGQRRGIVPYSRPPEGLGTTAFHETPEDHAKNAVRKC